MKTNIVKSIIAIAFSALLAYACYAICKYDEIRWLLTIASFVMFCVMSVMTFGLKAKSERSSVVLCVLSGTLLTVAIIMNFVFAFFDFSVPVYIILNGIVLLAYLMTYASIFQAKQ